MPAAVGFLVALLRPWFSLLVVAHPPSRGFVLWLWRMGSAAEVPVVISSDEEDGAQTPAAGKRKSPEDAVLAWAEGILDQEDGDDAVLEGVGFPAMMLELLDSLKPETGIVVGNKEGVVGGKNTNTVPDARGGDDDDDCVILAGDPDKSVAVAKEEGGPARDAAEDELQIVAEKGEVLLLRLLALICQLPLRVA